MIFCFEGPDASHAHELVQVDFAQQPESLSSSWLFSSLENNQLIHEGGYDPTWSIRFKAPALSTEPFQLAGKAYRIRPLQQQVEPFRPTDVYLDVNATWKKYQFTTAFWTAQRQQSKVWVFDDGLKEVTKANLGAVYEKLVQQQFSLFPIYRIAHPETALLITKGSKTGPTLENLKQSVFAERLQQSASLAIPIRAFWFDDAPSSPYLKTLAELRVLNLAKGTTCTLIHQLAKKNQFPRIADTPDQVAVPIAGVMIERQNSDTKLQGQQQAPDHLARLFAYNDIMQRVGRRYFDDTFKADTSLIATAQEAHILSPVSSLIVLETEYDYDRFGIKRDNKGLDNATLKEEGAVPEPHEWALLLAVLVFIGWVKVRWNKPSARVF